MTMGYQENRAMLRIAPLVLAGTLVTASLPVLAQVPGDNNPALRVQAVLPPSVTTAPGTTPSPSQQLQIQTYRNELERAQQPNAALTPQGLRDQLNAGEQLNQLNQQSR
jgi:hypothetical protein